MTRASPLDAHTHHIQVGHQADEARNIPHVVGVSGEARNDLQHDVLQRGNPPPLALLDAGTSSATSRKASMSRQIDAGALKITVTKHVPDRGECSRQSLRSAAAEIRELSKEGKAWEVSDGAGGPGLAYDTISSPLYPNDVLLAHLHAIRPNAPLDILQVELLPFGTAQLTRTHEHQRQ